MGGRRIYVITVITSGYDSSLSERLIQIFLDSLIEFGTDFNVLEEVSAYECKG
jgi:hypothetical protein